MDQGKPEILYGIVPMELQNTISNELGKYGTYLGSLKVVVINHDDGAQHMAPFPHGGFTIDHYTDDSGHLHEVIGLIDATGTHWEIKSDQLVQP